MKNIVVIFMLFFISVGCKSTFAENKYSYSPEKVSLSGELLLVNRYGPPNFGETPDIDIKLNIYTLKLIQAITVGTVDSLSDVNTDILNNVFEVQLIAKDSDYTQLKAFVGKKVSVYGALEQAVSSGDFLPVTLIIESITDEK